MNEWAWFMKRSTLTAFLVGWLWNGDPLAEAAVWMVALGTLILVEGIRDQWRRA